MNLSELIARAGLTPRTVIGDASILSIADDSRRVQPGSLFVCRESARTDSHEFLAPAREAGAVAALVHSESGLQKARDLSYEAILEVPSGQHEVLRTCGLLCQAFWGDPTAGMRVVGITGTNGKTTTAWMVREALTAMGRKAAYLGTLGYRGPGQNLDLENTTPFPVELFQIIAMAREAGCQDFVMEVSSHGLVEHRVAGVRFDVGVFTNLTQDHLDYHGSMEAYAEAKKKLFTEVAEASGKPFVAAISTDDPTGRAWIKDLQSRISPTYRILSYGEAAGEMQATAPRIAVDSLDLELNYQGETASTRLDVGGLFNVSNSRSAAAALLALGHSLEEVAQAMKGLRPIPGRFESVPNVHGIGMVIDYAHTPDALEKLLQSARDLKPRRIITVFGCGGDRDRTKRPLMAAVASRLSDLCIVTSDNPRTEDPDAIVAEVLTGIAPGSEAEAVVDRRAAVARAVELAEKGDLVVIAGKGHEDYQIIGRVKYPMDDRELARDALSVKGVSQR